jgi:anti-sigma-K factor RskA
MPDPTLSSTALRYAAGDLSPADCAAFEVRLASEQEARDAVAEAIRLSAAALHQPPPAPDPSFREAIRERLLGLTPGWLRRRAYRGHPITWTALGAVVVAACTVIGLALADRSETHETPLVVTPTPAPAPRAMVAQAPIEAEPDDADSVAEIWADLSTPDQIEKLHDDEQKWRQKLRDASVLSGRAAPVSATTDSRDP